MVILFAEQLGGVIKSGMSKVSEANPALKGLTEQINNLVSAGQAVAAFMRPIVFTFLIMPGAMMGYVVPMLPWVLWVSALLGWFILVVEAVIAAPLWALAHMRMDGEGIAGTMGEQGYRLALSILMRPILMIVGLVAGLVVLTIFIPFIGASIWVAEAMNDSAGVGEGFFQRAAIIVIQSFLMVYVCYRCFNLITHVPDRVLRWIGHGGEGLGESEPVEQVKSLFTAGIGGPGGLSSLGQMEKNKKKVSKRRVRNQSQNQNQTRMSTPP